MKANLFKSRSGAATLLFSTLVILGLVLTACGGSSGGQTPQTSGPKNSVLTASTGPSGDFVQNFGPYAAGVNTGTQGFIYETLLYFNRLDGSIKPWLASSYEFSSDAKSITFHLRPGVKWTDGQAFTSADVLFTLNMLKQYPAADGNGIWNYIDQVTAPDNSTVTVTLKQPYTPILWGLGGQMWVVPQHLWSNVGDPTKYLNTKPVGTGPYLLGSFTPQLLDYKRNPNYWQPGKPQVAEVRYPSFNSNTGPDLLLSQGSMDWTGIFTPNIDTTFVKRDPTHNHYWFPPGNVVMLYLNLTKSPFNLLPVRQAISTVLDRNQMYHIAESNYEPVAHPTALILPNNQSFLDQQYASLSFTQDVAKANQLMQSTGFTKGSDGIYVDKSGKPLSFNINVVTGWTDWVTNCQIMASNLKQIGINAKVNAISFNSYLAALQGGQFDMSISWTSPGPTPYYLYYSLLSSKDSAPVGQTAPSNWERWQDPATDTLLAQYATSTDKTVQQQALSGIEKVMVDQVPAIPLVYGATWYEYSTARFTGWPTKDNAYAVPAPYSYPDNEIVILNLKSV